MVVAYHCPHYNWTFENLQVFVRPKEYTERNVDYKEDNFTCISIKCVLTNHNILKNAVF